MPTTLLGFGVNTAAHNEQYILETPGIVTCLLTTICCV